jgi:hypothetical protein
MIPDNLTVDIPQEHRIEAKPVGNARLLSIEDGELNWQKDVGLHHYTCSCGESFSDGRAEEQIFRHLVDVGVLD